MRKVKANNQVLLITKVNDFCNLNKLPQINSSNKQKKR